jgi:hypothetical protein
MTSRFFVARISGMVDDLTIVAVIEGTEQEVRERILNSANFPSGSYLLLSKNAPVVHKIKGNA